MAVKLRLRREGGKKNAYFRVVAADSRSPRDGRFIEIIGHYNPTANPSVVEIDHERALHWLRHGAQPTNPVENLLRIAGVWETFKPGGASERVRTQTPVRTSDQARDQAARTADQSQVTGGGDAPARQAAAAPEEVEAAPGVPEDATAAPVAETEAVRGETEGGPGEGDERAASVGGGGGGSPGTTPGETEEEA